MTQAQRDLLKATVDLDDHPEKRLAALRKVPELAKEFVKTVQAIPNNTSVDLLQAKTLLLEARIELLREEIKSKPKK